MVTVTYYCIVTVIVIAIAIVVVTALITVLSLPMLMAHTIVNVIDIVIATREFKKLLRPRQRERHKTIEYNEKNKGPARAL